VHTYSEELGMAKISDQAKASTATVMRTMLHDVLLG
jgi:hypothetical protein